MASFLDFLLSGGPRQQLPGQAPPPGMPLPDQITPWGYSQAQNQAQGWLDIWQQHGYLSPYLPGWVPQEYPRAPAIQVPIENAGDEDYILRALGRHA